MLDNRFSVSVYCILSSFFFTKVCTFILVFSLLHTHMQTLTSVSLGLLAVGPSWAACNRAVRANKWQSSPFSPSTSHHSSSLYDSLSHFLCLSLSLSSLCSPSSFLLFSFTLTFVNWQHFFVLTPIRLYWYARKIPLCSSLPRKIVRAEYNSSNNALQSQAKLILKLYLEAEKNPWKQHKVNW